LECKSSERNKEAWDEVTIDMMIPKIKKFKYLDLLIQRNEDIDEEIGFAI